MPSNPSLAGRSQSGSAAIPMQRGQNSFQGMQSSMGMSSPMGMGGMSVPAPAMGARPNSMGFDAFSGIGGAGMQQQQNQGQGVYRGTGGKNTPPTQGRQW
jgi:hypothetical protein